MWAAQAADAPAEQIAKLKAALEVLRVKKRAIDTAFEAAKA